jgi:hypothetical protein
MFIATVLELNHLFSWVGLTSYQAIRLVESVVGAVAVGLVGFIAMRLWNRPVGLASAFVAAILPPLIYVGDSDLAQALSGPLGLAALAAAAEYRLTRKPWQLVASGALVGLSALTHPDMVLLLIPVAVAVWPRQGALRVRIGPVALFLLAFVVVMAPWTVRNEVKFHTFIPIDTSTGETLAGVYNNESQHSAAVRWIYPASYAPDEAIYRAHPLQSGQNTALERRAIDYIEAHPTSILRTLYWDTRRLVGLVPNRINDFSAGFLDVSPAASMAGLIAFWLAAALAIAGAFTSTIRKGPKWIWLAPLVLYIAEALLNTLWPRFQAPLDPFVAMLAGAGIVAFLDRLGTGPRLSRWRVISPS